MRRLGRKYLAVTGAGVAAAALAVISAGLGLRGLSLAALAGEILCVLAALTLVRLDHRQAQITGQRASSPSKLADESVDQAVFSAHLRTETRLTSELERTRDSIVGEVMAGVQAVMALESDNVAAVTQLLARHEYASPVGFERRDVTPRQVLDVLELVREVRPARALTLSTVDLALWLGYELISTGAYAQVVLADNHDVQRLTATASRHHLAASLSVVPAREVHHDLPHALLPWFDLEAVAPGKSFDLIVVGAATVRAQRAALPMLPLIADRLGAGALLAVLATNDHIGIVESWCRSPEVLLDADLSTASVAVFRATPVEVPELRTL